MRRLVLLVASIAVWNTLFAAALTPYLPRLAAEFDLSKTEAGILIGAYPAGILVGAIPGAVLSARLGVRRLVLLGLALMVVSTVAFALAPEVWMVEVARFAQGLSVALSWASSLAWLVGTGPRERRGELIGFATRGAIIGVLLGPVLGGAAGLIGRGTAFTTVALVGVALAAWAWRTPGPAHGDSQPVKTLLAAGREPRVAAGLCLGTLTALLIGVLSVLAPLALDRAGWGTIGVSAVFLAAAAVHAAATPSIGRLVDRRGRVVPVRVGLVLAIAVSLAIPWVGERWALAALVAAANVSYGTFFLSGMALLSDGAEAVGLHHSLGFTLMNVAWAPGQFAGAAGGGALADATGDLVPFLLVGAACFLTFAAVELWVFSERRGARRPYGRPSTRLSGAGVSED